jgi:glycosyltransferase involved in cell wall biosynthesis
MSVKLSVVVPVLNEEQVINEFILQTQRAIMDLNISYEFIFVDDGSTDSTLKLLKELALTNPKIKVLEFSYNHGKAFAVSAGIQHSVGEYILYMDPDLQDPPKEIQNFLKEMEMGFDLVWGIRREKKDNLLNNLFSKIFWSVLRKYTGLKIPIGIAVMRMFNRDFANEFLQYSETNRFIEGIFLRIGKNWTTIPIDQQERFAGVSKFTFRKKMKLAIDAILDYSEIPLKLASIIGFLIMGTSIVFGMVMLGLKYFVDFKSGWLSTILVIIFSMGTQLFFLGIMSLYLGKIYSEVKKRPLYSIKNKINI